MMNATMTRTPSSVTRWFEDSQPLEMKNAVPPRPGQVSSRLI